MEKLTLTDLVGESLDQIAQAEAKRSQAWARITVIKMDPELQAIKARIARINSAAWWLRTDMDSDEQLRWGVINACRYGMPKGAILPTDFYTHEAADQREAQSAAAAENAAFLGLPKLKGSEKQVAWANTIRDKFRDYCEGCGYDDAFIHVAKGKAAKTARFWIDHRSELDFKDLLTEAVNAAA